VDPIPAETVKLFREATGIGWMESKRLLQGYPPALRERVLRHIQYLPRDGGYRLHDPIEHDPEHAATIARMRRDITAEIGERRCGPAYIAPREPGLFPERSGVYPGILHHLMRERLAALGIDWYSPFDLNPNLIV
jgi:hypothetical protein